MASLLQPAPETLRRRAQPCAARHKCPAAHARHAVSLHAYPLSTGRREPRHPCARAPAFSQQRLQATWMSMTAVAATVATIVPFLSAHDWLRLDFSSSRFSLTVQKPHYVSTPLSPAKLPRFQARRAYLPPIPCIR